MALSRIIGYDRARGEVTYWYRDHLSRGKKTETVSRETFIGRMAQHILPKGFQRIRYYGLQATCVLKKVREQLATALPGVVQLALPVVAAAKRLTYRERLKATLGRDPQVCPRCGAEMWVWKIWHPKYGVLYDEGERLREEAEAEHERRTLIPLGRGRAGDAGRSGHVQLSLLAVSA